MLSYQHAYHAGNMADVHKHAALAWMLGYMAAKAKPLSYLETHAGRALYRLDGPEAAKTGEAAAGIAVAEARGWFDAGHPYARALAAVRAAHGAAAYPGSPMLAAQLLRDGDRMELAELHPAERAALEAALGWRPGLRVHGMDGLAMARALCPPEPRRGLMLIDPSYEVKAEYAALPGQLAALHRRWPVGVLVLWYPLLAGEPHAPMLAALEEALPGGLRHEVRFPPARPGHRMTGSGLFVVNPPWGLEGELARLGALFAAL
jgi:23S rRNA (adenine2030-N6)-methyltransferase